MYRTSHSVRIASAALAAVFGFGLVATAGGALREEHTLSNTTGLPRVKLDAVVITPQGSPRITAACEQAPKAAL